MLNRLLISLNRPPSKPANSRQGDRPARGLAKHRSLAIGTFHPLEFMFLLALKRQRSERRMGCPVWVSEKMLLDETHGTHETSWKSGIFDTCVQASHLPSHFKVLNLKKCRLEFLSLSLWCKRSEPNQSLKKSANPSLALAETSQGHAAAPQQVLK